MTDWIGWGGLAVATAALGVSGLTYWKGKEAIRAAQEAADSAKDSAATAMQALRVERAAIHAANAPEQPEVIQGHRAKVNGRRIIYASITVRRDYRVRGTLIYKDGSTADLSTLPLLIRANQPSQSEIVTPPPISEVEWFNFRFWPPDSSDPADHWECPCGAPYVDDDDGHWRWRVPAKSPRSPASHNSAPPPHNPGAL